MPDAGSRGDGARRRDGAGPRRGDAAGAVAAGAARASGERSQRRRRTTPLIHDPELSGPELSGPELSGPQLAPVADAAVDPAAETDRRSAAGAAAETVAEASGETGAEASGEIGAELAIEALVEAMTTGAAELPEEWERRAAEVLAFLRRRLTGDYEVDEFGFDRELNDSVLMPFWRPLFERWFRVEVRGIENIPDEGAALVVANHSGTLPLDAIMTQLAILDSHPAGRHLRMLGADLVFQLPFVGELARKSGTTLACNEDAERLLGRGELVGVWPEGFKGIGKPFSERYKLQRFGRGGFVSAALRTRAPIVPCSIVGAEEIFPILANLKTLARLLGVPYVPVTPTFPWLGPLGLVPLPSKWIIQFGEPISTDDLPEGAAEDPMLVFDLTDRVRETIQHTLYTLLMARRSVFF